MTQERFDFKPLSPRDGFRVERVALGELSLSLYLYSVVRDERQSLVVDGGDGSVLLMRWDNPTRADYAECARLELLLQSVVRYLNTGGNIASLRQVLDLVQMAIPGALVFPGWEYFEGAVNDRGEYEHIFVANDGSGDAVLWVEDQFIDTELSLTKIRKQQERHAERTSKRQARRAERRASAERCYRVELPDPTDHRPPQLPCGGSDARVQGQGGDG